MLKTIGVARATGGRVSICCPKAHGATGRSAAQRAVLNEVFIRTPCEFLYLHSVGTLKKWGTRPMDYPKIPLAPHLSR
jgi:hypothetical protein